MQKNKYTIKVGIIDSTSNIKVEKNKNFVTAYSEKNPIFQDLSGHGTAVAGLLSSDASIKDESVVTTTKNYTKELNPGKYQENVDVTNYYNQFDDAMLQETITENKTDCEGNIFLSTTLIKSGNSESNVTTSTKNDDFGRTLEQAITRKTTYKGKWNKTQETITLYTYDVNGNVAKTEVKSRIGNTENWTSHVTESEYNENGQLIKEYSPRGEKERVASNYTYDIMGNRIKEEVPLIKTEGGISYQTTLSEYDINGNLTATEKLIDDTNAERTEYSYDERENLVLVKNCLVNDNAQYAQYVYDTFGNKVRQFIGMTKPLNIEVTESETDSDDYYLCAGHKYYLKVSDKKKEDKVSEEKYEYDSKNQLITYTDAEGRSEYYTYDDNGNLIETKDKNGNVIKNTYNIKNQLVKSVAKDKRTNVDTIHDYKYDTFGRTIKQDNTSFEYNNVTGEVTKEITKLTNHTDVEKNYDYDSAGNKTDFKVNVGDKLELCLNYQYDGEGKLCKVLDSEGSELAKYDYDLDGNLAKRVIATNNQTSTYHYNYQNQLEKLTNETKQNGVISTYSSTYQLNGLKTQETSSLVDKKGDKKEATVNYQYDLMSRLTKESKNGKAEVSYEYDSHNNRSKMITNNETTAYRYNANNELLRADTLNQKTKKDSVVTYKNDKNGNQLGIVNRFRLSEGQKDKPYLDVDITLGENRLNENVVNHYNALNQLTTAMTKNYKVSFTYDANGLRESKTANGDKTVYVWDNDQLVMELSKGGKVKKRYIRGNDLIYADSGKDSEKTYYVTDSHANVVQLLDEAGNITKSYEYDAFGNEVKPETKDDNPFRYCGEYYDKELGEIYLRARYYQPKTGRFITRDSYLGQSDEPESLHLYTYCENDGVNNWDPSGNCYIVKNVYSNGRKIKIDKVWNSNCGKKIHKYVTDKKIKDQYYLSAIEKIKEITTIKNFDLDLIEFEERYKKNFKKYNKISKKSKVPPQLVAAIHYRENTADYINSKFDVYLHNGEYLGTPTTMYPKNVFFHKGQFVKAAIAALKSKNLERKKYKLNSKSKDMAAMLAFAEGFNGRGYSDNHEGNNPYLYSGTNAYSGGKYAFDGQYDKHLVDQQAGVFILINKII